MMDNQAQLIPTNRLWFRLTIALIALMTIGRIIALIFSPITLHADETQYWVWSREFDWGYFSKPPMIAWIIATSTSVFGNSEAAIRLPVPLLHAATASFLYLCAQRLWDNRTGFWVALVYLTMPGIWLSNGIISTDVLLFTAWTGGLYCLLRLRDGEDWPSAIGLGAAVGLGFLSKYAMIYFVVGTLLAIALDRPTRMAMMTRNGLIAATLAGLLLLPNILWNSANDFATVSHTAANANWGGDLFQTEEMFEFLAAQFFVFGPAVFVTLLIILALTVRDYATSSDNSLLLTGFCLPPLAIVTLQAFLSRAHGNWAASAYMAGTLLVVSFLLRGASWRRYVLVGSIAIHSVMGIGMAVLAPNPSLIEAVGMSNATKRIRGWRETGAAITEAAMAEAYDAIVFDNRNVFHQMQRYAPDLHRPLNMWLRYSGPSNHAEQSWPLADGFSGRVLIVSERPSEVARMREDFERFEPLMNISIPLDGVKTRELTLWEAEGYLRIERDAEYEARWLEVDEAQSR
jgi:4-amino-4-deoxy-L-arabinose transferase-like glycosyltransferase